MYRRAVSFSISADHFEKAGVDPAGIKTVDDFTEALRKLKEYYKDVDNYYPLQGREAALIFQSWFNCSNNISSEESNGFTTITSTAAMIFMQTALIKWWRR